MENVRARLKIEGRVQGVWFRESTRRQAQSLGVKGWVRNCQDGSVEVLAEGPSAAVDKLIQWSNQGPPAAHVDRVKIFEETWKGEFDSFIISR
jgi:acylphosphatase